MASVWSLQFHSPFPHRVPVNVLKLRQTELGGFNYYYFNCNRKTTPFTRFVLNASGDSATSSNEDNRTQDESLSINVEDEKTTLGSQNFISRFQQSICSLAPVIFSVKTSYNSNSLIGMSIVATILVVALRAYATRRRSQFDHSGSVADLVRRGQLRSDRRGISSPLKYEDPFNNPLVKVGKSSSTVEMCGKVYRLAPVTLTKEQQNIHQKRRSRAYQWKRPTVFLREGDSIPPDVDPDTVRWIPANHPFATTTSDIDENLAQNNVHQKHGVPFRIQAEHEALQRKLEALQDERKLNNLVIDPSAAKDFERPFKSHVKLDNQGKPSPSNHESSSKPGRSDRSQSAYGSNATSEELQ